MPRPRVAALAPSPRCIPRIGGRPCLVAGTVVSHGKALGMPMHHVAGRVRRGLLFPLLHARRCRLTMHVQPCCLHLLVGW